MPLVDPLEAVSAVFVHGEKVFAVERQPYLTAFPGYLAFPGGKIDRDEDFVALSPSFFPELDRLHLHALSREMQEELGLDLERAFSAKIVETVTPLASAMTPHFVSFRFRNWFYRVELKKEVEFLLDNGEFTEGYWITPGKLLELFSAGKALMVPPTRWLLEKLDVDIHCRELGDLTPRFDETREIPELMMLEGVRMLMVPSATLPPADQTNAFRLGDGGSPQILVDPSPESDKVYQRLLNTLAYEDLDSVFLTHHHPDHHQTVARLARERHLQVLLSEDTHRRILEKFGVDYFSGLEISSVSEGDEITRWHKEEVRVHSVPGHDAGQLALAPESLAWFIVGDLIQGIGTVVISAPEGDMSAYFQTLKSVIALQPSVIIPSHGLPMRGTHRLEAVLRHRLEREQQVLELHRSGMDETQMLRALYHHVNVSLHPYARKNIISHLFKLRLEGRL